MISGTELSLDNPSKTLVGETKRIMLDGRTDSRRFDMLQGNKSSVIIASRFEDNKSYISIRERYYNMDDWSGDESFEGLLLEAVPNMEGVYRRIAYLKSYSITWDELEPLLAKQTITII